MKLWDKGFSIDKQIEQFTVGNDREIDLHIAKYDVQASMAHAKMLASIGIIAEDVVNRAERNAEVDTVRRSSAFGKFSLSLIILFRIPLLYRLRLVFAQSLYICFFFNLCLHI